MTTESKIVSILAHHEEDLNQLERQLTEERLMLDADIDRIRARAGLRGVDPAADRVMSSPGHDESLLNVIAAIDQRRERFSRQTEYLTRMVREIEAVHAEVLALPSKLRSLILTLYYPRRTYSEAAEILGIDLSTITRRRQRAIEALCEAAERKNIFSQNAHPCT